MSSLSRRQLLGGTAASLISAASFNLFNPPSLTAQSTSTPDAALQTMLEGNSRFVSGKMTSLDEDLKILKAHTVEKQEPFAAILSCADSRVPAELIFDQTIGHLFVTRVAGNVVTSEIIASLEYGAAVLGTKVILVLGHRNCGAVKAAIEGKEVPGQISSLYPHLQPAVDKAGTDLVAVTHANASIQADLLRKSSPVLAPMVKENKLKIVAGYYDIETGKVSLIEG